MRVAVSGSTGLVGSEVVTVLSAAGHDVVRLVRRAPAPGEKAVRWDPAGGVIDAGGLDGMRRGGPPGGGERRLGPLDRRPEGGPPRQPCERDALPLRRPRGARPGRRRRSCGASAIGYYGDRGEEPLTEESPPGAGFLAEVCREWEAASAPAARRGSASWRCGSGMVLSPKGGALARMLPLFRAGLGGVIGGGRQHISWVALDDLPGIVLHALQRGDLVGPVNAVAPRPVTNREFTVALGKALSRPTPLPRPGLRPPPRGGGRDGGHLAAGERARDPAPPRGDGVPISLPGTRGGVASPPRQRGRGYIPGATPGTGEASAPP